MAELLGFEGPLVNSYGCIASVDYVTGLYSAIKLVFLHLGRVVQDLAFWSSFEVGQLYVPNALVQISSIMPQKRNPVPIEHMRHLASATCGRCDMVVNTMHNTPFTDMNDSEGEVQQAGYAAFDSGGRVLDLMTAFLPACSINSANVRRNTDAASITITELADTLVRDEGLTFRQSHEIAAHIARSLDGEPLTDGYTTFRLAFQAATARAPKLDEAAFRTATSPETFVARRDRIGGPAPAALEAALTSYVQVLYGLRTESASRKQRITDAETARAITFAQLLET
jgi:argininosuccinate lyase